ncbi:preprotein translocase subunit SecE [Candidatus Saccharibacteria bacterium]|nr:preprotein translocase subunit SecE [Candidatus Saccharibacteria bacterium]
MAVTKIKATDPAEKKPKETKKAKAPAKEAKPKAPAKTTKSAEKTVKPAKTDTTKQPFILLRPFVALGRYVRNSWNELRQVHWPNRKYTWQMTVAMLIYCAIFFAFIVLLDALFSLIFNNLLGGN